MFKKSLLLFGFLILGVCVSFFYAKNKWIKPYRATEVVFENGDIIFQTSRSQQSKAIQLATHSPYSHCGLVYKHDNEWFVFEAVQPVKSTPLNQWIKRGKGESFVLKRLRNRDEILTKSVLKEMEVLSKKFQGKNYDLTFEWSDDKMYCSELVWKIYKRTTGLEIGTLQKLKDFDLSHPIVKQKMLERYANQIPLDEKVISPDAIFKSDLLIEVVQ